MPRHSRQLHPLPEQRQPRPLNPRPAPVRFAPATSLALPRLSPSVPPLYNITNDTAALSTLLEGLLRHGILQWTGNPLNDLQHSFESWINLHTNGLPIVESSFFTFTDHLGSISDCPLTSESLELDPGALALCINDNPSQWQVKDAISALESRHPALGATILHILEASLNVVGCSGPMGALSTCMNMCWMGDSDESFVLNEHLPENATAEQREAVIKDLDLLTKADFHKEIPESLFARPLTHAQLQAIAQRDPSTAEVIHTALAIGPVPRNTAYTWFEESETQAPICLLWEEHGIVGRLYDAFGDDIINSGLYHSLAYFEPFYTDNPTSVEDALRNLESAFSLLHRAQALLNLVGKKL